MTKLLMALLPSKYKAMFEVSEKIFQNMKTDEQRKDIFDYILVMFDEMERVVLGLLLESGQSWVVS